MQHVARWLKEAMTHVFSHGFQMRWIHFGILLIISFASASKIMSKKQEKELKLLHIVMRHGARTPVSTYPKDPYINEEFLPNGWGQLTNNGIKDLHNFGGYLRQRYSQFLGTHYNSTEVYCEATGVDRALASIMAVNSGLWKPVAEQQWSKELSWFPIPILSQPLDEDMLLLVRKDCPQYNIELEKVQHSKEFLTKMNEFGDLFKYVEESTGMDVKNYLDVEDVYTTLLAEESYGLKLPEWAKDHMHEMEKGASMSFVLKAYNDKLSKLKGGVLLKKLISDWELKSAGKLKRKLFLYGGHDTTVSNLLSALHIFDPQVPSYGMAVMFEFYLEKQTNKYGLEIFVKNSTAKPYRMRLPGCDHFCYLDDVIKLTVNTVPLNWEAECASDDPNYKPSKPSGP